MKQICNSMDHCTGCTACASVCPKNCITMETNSEGFLYPIINTEVCVNCGACEKVCPVNHPVERKSVLKGYVVRNRSMGIVESSTSGGTCAAFAEYTFSRDGILVGAGYDSELKVRHFSITKDEKSRVEEMKGSKYVQSDLGNLFPEIKANIKSGKFVFFIGTPCQVAGLKAFLKKEYENLLTADLVCHGVSSPLVFKKYVRYQASTNHAKPVTVNFRNKTYGYHSGTMMIQFENGKRYYGSGRIDHMAKAYFAGACSRKSCYNCPYKSVERCSDFTLFDSWHISKLIPGKRDDDKGYTNVFIHTEKGLSALLEMEGSLELYEADILQMHQLDGVMIEKNPHKAECRDQLLQEIENNNFHAVMQKYLPVSKKDHLLEKTKSLAYKIGVLSLLKRF